MTIYTTMHGKHYIVELDKTGDEHKVIIRNKQYKTKVHERVITGSPQQWGQKILREWDAKPDFVNGVGWTNVEGI